MIILGIDPGIAVTGYGVIQFHNGTSECIAFGAIRTGDDQKKEIRLFSIFQRLNEIIQEYHPDMVAVEQLFFNRNTKTALAVGESRGVVLLTVGMNQLPLYEYTPLQVKECLTGYGRATKNQVREVVQMELNMEKPPRPIDASDALAIALTHSCLRDLDLIGVVP